METERLISLFKQLSPTLWEIGMQQVRVTFYKNALALGIMALAAVMMVILFLCTKRRRAENTELADTMTAFAVFQGIASTVAALAIGLDLIQIFVNPQYVALKQLLDLLP